MQALGGSRTHCSTSRCPACEPCPWTWYVVDSQSGEVFEYAVEYESPLAVRLAGMERFEELASSLDKVIGGTAATQD